MSNTDLQRTFHRIMGASLLLSGFAVLTLASHSSLLAQATSQGSSLRSLPTSAEVRYEAASTLLPPTPTHTGSMSEGALVALGMLLVLAGLGVHAALTLRNERPVHVTDVTQKREQPARLRRNIDVIWIERKFRV